MTLQEQRDIIQAAIDGKTIQMRQSGEQDYRDRNISTFNFGFYEYRLKPQPREFFVALYKQTGLIGGAFDSVEEAKRHNSTSEIIRAREVID